MITSSFASAECFTVESESALTGITFHLPTYRRFIPYSWLEYVEMDRDENEMRLTYTHSLVVVKGKRLGEIQLAAEKFELRSIRECIASSEAEQARPCVSRIEIMEVAT